MTPEEIALCEKEAILQFFKLEYHQTYEVRKLYFKVQCLDFKMLY